MTIINNLSTVTSSVVRTNVCVNLLSQFREYATSKVLHEEIIAEIGY